MRKLAWIALTFVLVCGTMGCRTSNSMKVVTDITPQGEVSWHTEYEVQW